MLSQHLSFLFSISMSQSINIYFEGAESLMKASQRVVHNHDQTYWTLPDLKLFPSFWICAALRSVKVSCNWCSDGLKTNLKCSLLVVIIMDEWDFKVGWPCDWVVLGGWTPEDCTAALPDSLSDMVNVECQTVLWHASNETTTNVHCLHIAKLYI